MAHGTGGQAVVLLGPGSAALAALLEPRHLNIGAQAVHGVFQIDLEIVAEIFAALRARAPPAAASTAEQIAESEEVPENVAEIGECRGIEAAALAGAGEALMTVAVVHGPLLRIAQNAVGFRGFLKFFFRGVVVRVTVRMVFQSKLTVSAFQHPIVAVTGDAEYLVVIALHDFLLTATFTNAVRSSRPRKL